MAHSFGTGTGFGGGRGDSGPGDTPQFGKPASAPLPTPQHVGHSVGASIGDCHYFLQGICTKVSSGNPLQWGTCGKLIKCEDLKTRLSSASQLSGSNYSAYAPRVEGKEPGVQVGLSNS